MEDNQFKSRTYQIYELRDALQEGIKKNQELLEREKEFLAIIDKSGKADKFDFMTKDLRDECKKLEHSIEILKIRHQFCLELVRMYEMHNEASFITDKVVTLLLEAIGAATEPETK